MKFIERLREDELRGVRYAANVFVATTVLWIVVKVYGDSNPIWAISAMVATSDPQLKQSLATFRGRLINTLVGCAIGLLVIAVGMGLEGEIEMMRPDQARLLDAAQSLAHDAAQRRIGESLVADKVLCHGYPRLCCAPPKSIARGAPQ